ncbi:MAG: Uma2 family endonuclease [Cytophagales bacterium]|nr:MAG: Uma2 family endonuclease [Cytophagales bacterium]
MFTTIEKNQIISEEQYLINEAKANFKSEYHNGEVIMMAGATLNHNRIVSNLIGELYNCLKNKKCEVLPSDMLLKLPACKKYVYPDITIVCDEIMLDENKKQGLDVLLNPSIVIEVLSESTKLFDKTEKLNCYCTLQSLQQYIMIDSEKFEIIIYTRTENNDWLMHIVANINEKIKIGKCEIDSKDIYIKVVYEIEG